MSAASRRKGLTGEREIALMFAAARMETRALEGTGDMLAFRAGVDGINALIPIPVWHIEVKRYRERARWPEWWGQAKGEAPPGVPPLLCAREDGGEWLSLLRTADLLDVIA